MKKGLNFERHVEIGRQLVVMREQLMFLWSELEHAYPKNATCCREFGRIVRLGSGAIDQVRCDLDSRCAREYPDKFQTEIYYGGPKGEDRGAGTI